MEVHGMTTARQLAEQMHDALTRDTRNDGTIFWHLRDGSPEWMNEVTYKAHADMMPDDWRYSFIYEALAAIVGTDEDADEDAMREAIDEIEADIDTHDLTSWLGSRADRYKYVDDTTYEYGGSYQGGIIAALQLGQWYEKRETGGLLLDALIEQAETQTEAEDN